MQNHHGEVIGVLQLINRKRDFAAPTHVARGGGPADHRLQPAYGEDRQGAGGPGGGLDREQPAVRGDRAAVRGIREGGGAPRSSSATRPPRATPSGSRSARWRSPRLVDRVQDGPFRLVKFTPEQIREIRYAGPAARLREGRRAGAGAGQGQEALRERAGPDPAAPRIHPAERANGLRKGAGRLICCRNGTRGLRRVPRWSWIEQQRGGDRDSPTAFSRWCWSPTSRRCWRKEISSSSDEFAATCVSRTSTGAALPFLSRDRSRSIAQHPKGQPR